jgi:hypothetical protein
VRGGLGEARWGMGISLFGKRRPAEGTAASEAKTPSAPPAAAHSPSGGGDGKERLTANEWARRHQLNEVAAERAAMRAGKWHDLFTEEEFTDLIKRADV